jgi:hypothetical protein
VSGSGCEVVFLHRILCNLCVYDMECTKGVLDQIFHPWRRGFSGKREGHHNLCVHGEGHFCCVTMRFWWRDKGTSLTHSEVCGCVFLFVCCFNSIFW